MRIQAWLISISVGIGAVWPAHSQLVPDGAIATVNGFATNVTGNLVVGTNGSFTSLVITNVGVVTNSGNGIVGQSAAATSNSVVVTDAGSEWTMGGNLLLGSFGSQGRVIVTNGGKVANDLLVLGQQLFSAYNSAILTGTNSFWTNTSSVTVGQAGPSNELRVANGGTLVSGQGIMGSTASSDGNLAVVTGMGTRWVSSGPIIVGLDSKYNQLFVTNGARIGSVGAFVGANFAQSGFGSSNAVLLSGEGSSWTNTSLGAVGNFGSANRLTISNGAVLVTDSSFTIGTQTSGRSNVMVVAGTNSLFSNTGVGNRLNIGLNGSFNSLRVTGGGVVESHLGSLNGGSNNVAEVSDPGSQWNSVSGIFVGELGANNQLLVTNDGRVVTGALYLGYNPPSTGNSLDVHGGSVIVTNLAGTGTTDARGGVITLTGGLLLTDRLLLTNGLQSQLTFSGGVLQSRNTVCNNTVPLYVGDGAAPASFGLIGQGLHSFADGLTIRSNATLTGNGTINGTLTVEEGGEVGPGASIGRIVLSNSPELNGAVVMETGKNGTTLTNDQVQVAAPVTYGGALELSHLGPTALAVGDKFNLFNAPGYSGSFASLLLPALPAGLNWTNQLLVDGSIEVVASAGPQVGGVDLSGTDLILQVTDGFPGGSYELLTSTDLTLPLANWTILSSGTFDWLGHALLTNGIAIGELERYYRILQP